MPLISLFQVTKSRSFSKLSRDLLLDILYTLAEPGVSEFPD